MQEWVGMVRREEGRVGDHCVVVVRGVGLGL